MLRALSTLVLSIALLHVGCSSGAAASGASGDAGAFPAIPYMTATSDSGQLHIEIRTVPQPPQRGTCSLALTITDARGAPVDGLTVEVVPWMPSHAHGTSVTPTVTPSGGGKYVVTDVSLFMAGDWELRMTFDGPIRDHAAPTFSIP